MCEVVPFIDVMTCQSAPYQVVHTCQEVPYLVLDEIGMDFHGSRADMRMESGMHVSRTVAGEGIRRRHAGHWMASGLNPVGTYLPPGVPQGINNLSGRVVVGSGLNPAGVNDVIGSGMRRHHHHKKTIGSRKRHKSHKKHGIRLRH